MSVATFEGIVENGRVKLPENMNVPERTKVYVVIPNGATPKAEKVMSPRLADPEQIKDFEMIIVSHASV